MYTLYSNHHLSKPVMIIDGSSCNGKFFQNETWELFHRVKKVIVDQIIVQHVNLEVSSPFIMW